MKLAPEWVSGFVDGEGTFYVGINRNTTMSSGYQILPEFRIVQHKKDIQVLYALKIFFKCGVVRINHDDRYELRIRSIEHINLNVIPHFDQYQLVTQKKFDFVKFKEIITIINQKQHLSIDGVKKVIKIACRMNRHDKYIAKVILEELDITDKIKSIPDKQY
jgi:hypothetical protein